MQLRERQLTFKDRCIEACRARGNTLGVAPTGSGKTVMGAAIAGELAGGDGQVMWLQHRDELLQQNQRTFMAVNPHATTCVYNADAKRLDEQAIFGSIDTIKRPTTLAKMPRVRVLVVDEAHHSAADGWQRTIAHFKDLNPDLYLLGLTATPNRGDKRALRGIFSNCADQISLTELINARHLVRPRTLVIDIGVTDELKGVRKLASDFDMSQVEAIMDHVPLNEAIVTHWAEHARERKTVAFCSTVAHAQHVAETFRQAGIEAATVWGEMPDKDRRDTLHELEHGDLQVVTNVAVLSEGWDCPPVSCILLLRPSSYKSTMIQMIGRGLRKIDPERHPGVLKDDCIVIDFGTSVLLHGALEQETDLDQQGIKECPVCAAIVPAQSKECPICAYVFPMPVVEAPTKRCPSCGAENPAAALVCEECGEAFKAKEKPLLAGFVLTEIDLLHDSPYRWENLFDGSIVAANAIDYWANVVWWRGRWIAIGAGPDRQVKILADNADRLLSMASADDYLRQHGDAAIAGKTKYWLNQPASEKQLQYLGMTPSFGLNRYKASCLLSWFFAERQITARLKNLPAPHVAEAAE